MTGEHTPGPWRAVGSDDAWQVVAEGNALVVEIPVGWTEEDDARIEPDARLIAAAPDLLEALEVFARCADQLDGDEYTPRAPDDEWAKFRLLVDDYRRARAAVLKARGEA